MGIDGSEIKRLRAKREEQQNKKSSPDTAANPPQPLKDQHQSDDQERLPPEIPAKGKYSVGSIFLGVIFVLTVVGIIIRLFEDKPNSLPNNYSSINSEPPKLSWKTSESKDKMTESISYFAFSPTISPTRTMDFPYGDVKSWLGVGCGSGFSWAYLGFNVAPNLNDDETKDGYSLITARIRLDQQIEVVYLIQTWGSKVLDFQDNTVISKIASAEKVILELQWHGEGSTYFEYPLEGAQDVIAQTRSKCDQSR